MRWYNPTIQMMEDVPAPLVDAQAIDMLSGHPNSGAFIEEYRRLRAVIPDIVAALIFTGALFYCEHREEKLPG